MSGLKTKFLTSSDQIFLKCENTYSYPHASPQFIGIEWFRQISIGSCL